MADREKRVEELFRQASTLPPGQQRNFLNEECSDPSLREDVLSLLDILEENPDFMESPEIPGGEAGDGSTRLDEKDHIPDIVGDFRIIRRIGQGGMATVFEAEQISLGRRVALKIIPAQFSLASETTKRFQREARTGGRHRHPGVVTIHAIGSHAGMNYLAMELAAGTLFDELNSVRRRSQQLKRSDPAWFDEYLRRMVSLFIGVADALEHIHQRGIIHRDIKPSNLLFSEDHSRLIIADFGIARDESSSRITRSGEMLGTFRYMSPEQLLSETTTIDHRTDIWSLGVSLYEAVTLSLPYTEKSSGAYINAVSTRDPAPAREREPAVPPALETVLTNCLARNPEQRYSTAAALREDLTLVYAGQPTSPIRPRTGRQKKRLAIRLWTVVMALLLVIIGGVSWWVSRLDSATAPGRQAGEGVDSTTESADALNVTVPLSWQENRVQWINEPGGKVIYKDFPAEIVVAERYDERNKRCVILYGGCIDHISHGRPKVAIYSMSGVEIVEGIDLLEIFNPFKAKFNEDYYKILLRSVVDQDMDGYCDLVVECRHTMYPSILYYIPGNTLQCTAGFANSGHVYKVIPTAEEFRKEGSQAIAVLATNNPMGHQGVVFHFTPSTLGDYGNDVFWVSPDMDLEEYQSLVRYRPLGIVHNINADLVSSAATTFTLQIDNRSIDYDLSTALSTDPDYGSSFDTNKAFRLREKLYQSVCQGRMLVEKDPDGKGRNAYRQAENIAEELEDAGLGFYVQMDAARSYKRIGRIDEALNWLSRRWFEPADKEMVQLHRAQLLILNRQYQGAIDASKKSTYNTSGCEILVTASILKGLDAAQLHESIRIEYPKYINWPIISTWLLIPGILQGNVQETAAAIEGLEITPYEKHKNISEKMYREEEIIWKAFRDLELSISPIDLPDEDVPIEDRVQVAEDSVRKPKIQLLKAYSRYSLNNEREAYADLEQAYADLKRLSQSNENAVIPYVLSAYLYGYAAREAGEMDNAREALEEALEYYPHGRRAEDARRFLADEAE